MALAIFVPVIKKEENKASMSTSVVGCTSEVCFGCTGFTRQVLQGFQCVSLGHGQATENLEFKTEKH